MLVNFFPVHRYSIDFFRKYLVLTESRTPLKPVQGSLRIVALSISSHMNRLNKAESAVSNIVGSLYFRRIRFFQIIYLEI